MKARKRHGRAFRVIRNALIALVAVVLCALLFRAIYRAAFRAHHAISPPGVDALETVEIGGIPQVIYARGQSADNPVVLYLHGGPGSPILPAIHTFQYAWEQRFTIVHWDQRLSGKTFFASDPEAAISTVSFERAVADAWEVTQYIRQAYGKDKIVVLGHSWGTVLATALVQTHPEAYSALISVGEVVKMEDMERARYEKTLELARKAGDEKDVADLEALAPFPPEHSGESLQRSISRLTPYLLKYKLMSGITWRQTLGGLLSPYYSLNDLRYYGVDAARYQAPLLTYLNESYDPRAFGVAYTLPVYFIMGENDFVTPYPVTKAFFDEIQAPDKAFYSIPNAGHVPMAEQADEFTRILCEEIYPKIANK